MKRRMAGELPEGWKDSLPKFSPEVRRRQLAHESNVSLRSVGQSVNSLLYVKSNQPIKSIQETSRGVLVMHCMACVCCNRRYYYHIARALLPCCPFLYREPVPFHTGTYYGTCEYVRVLLPTCIPGVPPSLTSTSTSATVTTFNPNLSHRHYPRRPRYLCVVVVRCWRRTRPRALVSTPTWC